MKRKVILHGPATLTVSLPSKWAKSNGIKKGSEVSVIEDGSCIRVCADEGSVIFRKASMDLSGLDVGTINSLLSVVHKSGYDEVEIAFSDQSTVALIQERINTMLMGYEIVEQKGKSCTIRSISTDLSSDLDNLVRRCFLITISIGAGIQEELRAGNLHKLNDLLVLENTMNKLTNYCHRLLNKKTSRDEKTTYLYLITWILESICDDYRDLIKLLSAQKRQFHPSKGFLTCLEEANGLVNEYYHLFYNYSDSQLMSLRQRVSSIKKKIGEIRASDSEAEPKQILLGIVSRVYDCLGSTAGMNH